MPVENLFARRFQAEIAGPCRDRYKELLYISTKIRSRWLFKEIACRMIGDPSQDDTSILSDFYDLEVQELILEKRENLSRRMKNTDHELLRLKPPKKTSRVQRATTIAYATAAFRDDINKHLDTYHKCGLRKYYQKYRTMKDHILRVPNHFEYSNPRFERFQRDFSSPDVSQSDFEAAYRCLQLRASKLVDPLLKSAVEEPVKKFKKNWYDRGLLSMSITENEIPWKDKPC
ncbi:hypothetical protein MMC28_000106 [Mycoblastus sanguinarius]|nr:hypothetical protein [Mycoblastus sanguinarius]